MTAYLNNWSYFAICLFDYILILIISLNVCGFFRFVNSLSFVKNIAGKINNLKFFATVKNYSNKYIIHAYLLLQENILHPLLHSLLIVLSNLSQWLISASRQIEKHISEILKEGFELLCLVTRKSINAEYKSVWSAIFAAIVLIYIILTNV
jgi:hypothetical protein